MAEKYKATPNNPEYNPEQLEKQQKEGETKDNLKDAAKLGIKAYAAAHGGEAVTGLVDPLVDKVAETPGVGQALDKLSKNKQVQKVAEKAKPLVDAGNMALDAKGGKGGAVGAKGAIPGGIPKTGGFSPKGGMTGIKPSSSGISSKSTPSSSPLGKNPLDLKSGADSSNKSSSSIQDKMDFVQKVAKFIAKYPHLSLVLLIIALIAFILFIFMLNENKGEGNDNDISYTYEQCKEVTVTDTSGNIIGIVSLEEYIMGVVNGEIGVFNDLETAKALSVAARTYVMDRSGSCSKAIISSSNVQVYNPNNISPLTKQAVTETAGQILKRNGSLISAEYDAFCYKGNIENENYTICQPSSSPEGKLQVPVIWAENVAASEGSSIDYLQKHSHGRGMSQFGAYYLSTVKNWDYEHILHYFYGDDVSISLMITEGSMGGLVQNRNGFLMRIARPERNNSYYYAQDVNNFGLGENEGECAWYAVHRTNEIIAMNGLSSQYNSVVSGGNGGQFCESSDYNQFEKSFNVDDSNIQAGTLYSTKSSYYGHIAVIEDVIKDSSGNINRVRISEGYLSLGDFSNTPFSSSSQVQSLPPSIYKFKIRKTICETNNSGCTTFYETSYKSFVNYLKSKNFKCYIFVSKNKSV